MFVQRLFGWKEEIMRCKKRQLRNVESCYHTSSVTHLADVFGFTLYLFNKLSLISAVCVCVLRFQDVTLQCLIKDKGWRRLKPWMRMRYKTDHMVACCTTAQMPLCVRPAVRVKLRTVAASSCQLLRLCDVYFRCIVSVSRQISQPVRRLVPTLSV